jgi:hypothetical protein
MLKFSYPVRMTLKSKSNLAGSRNGSSTTEHILFQQTDIKLKKNPFCQKNSPLELILLTIMKKLLDFNLGSCFNVPPKNLPHKTSASEPLNPDQVFVVNLDPGFRGQKISNFTVENFKYLYVKNTIFIFSVSKKSFQATGEAFSAPKRTFSTYLEH